MSQFDFWRRWGLELNDTEFANAWAALGIVDIRQEGAPHQLVEHCIASSDGKPLPWRFPKASRTALLHRFAPRQWADAWTNTVGDLRIQLIVVDFPHDEPFEPAIQYLKKARSSILEIAREGSSGIARHAATPQGLPKGRGQFDWFRFRSARGGPTERDPPTGTHRTLRTVNPVSQPTAPQAGSLKPDGQRGTEATPEETSDDVSANLEARFLQQKSFVFRNGKYREATHGFIADAPARVSVFIGLPKADWNSLPTAFPAHELSQDQQKWVLDVWLAEPEHLPESLVRSIELPRAGDSKELRFDFTPNCTNPKFDGCVTVTHRGRVIQTAILRGSVQPDAEHLEIGSEPRLEDDVQVRHGMGNMNVRRHFDLAFVLSHTIAGQPRSVALAAKRAWISDLSEASEIAGNISARLSEITKSVPDYADGIKGLKGLALLVDLAREGATLRQVLVEDQLGAAGNQPDIAQQECIQIVSTTHDAVIPFEFIYDFDAPTPRATLCSRWMAGIENGEMPLDCPHHTRDEVCPSGFWGLRKIIERHQVTPENKSSGRDLYLQSEPSDSRSELDLNGSSIYGASRKVSATAIASLDAKLKTITGRNATHASSWADWIDAVKTSRPKILIALAHSDGSDTGSCLEINGDLLDKLSIDSSYILVNGDPSPLVALLGCDMAGTANSVYGNYARAFRRKGAAIVVATIATVLAEHAPMVAESLVAGLLDKNTKAPKQMGEAMRAIKRQALLNKQIMPLCLVAYGDADWRIKRN